MNLDRNSDKIFIHIGYAKTGTTFLQRKIFNKLRGYIQIDHKDAKKFYESIIYLDSSIYDQRKVLIELEKSLENKKNNKFKGLIFSNERLEIEGLDLGLVAARLKNLFPNASILITLREQFDLLYSWYLFKGYSSKFSDKPFKGHYTEINEFIENGIESKKNNFISRLNFYDTYILYSNLFGKNKIHLLFYEDIFSQDFNLSEFISKTFDCEIDFEIDKKQKLNFRSRGEELLKHSNLYFNREITEKFYRKEIIKFIFNFPFIFINKNLSPIIKKSNLFKYDEFIGGLIPRIKDKNLMYLNNLISASNQKLQKETNSDLKKKGYLL